MGCGKKALLLECLGGKLMGKIQSKQSTNRPPKKQCELSNLSPKRRTPETEMPRVRRGPEPPASLAAQGTRVGGLQHAHGAGGRPALWATQH